MSNNSSHLSNKNLLSPYYVSVLSISLLWLVKTGFFFFSSNVLVCQKLHTFRCFTYFIHIVKIPKTELVTISESAKYLLTEHHCFNCSQLYSYQLTNQCIKEIKYPFL